MSSMDDFRFTPTGESYTDAKRRIRENATPAFYDLKMFRSRRRGPCSFLYPADVRARSVPSVQQATSGHSDAEVEVWEERNGPAPVVDDLPTEVA